MCTYVTVNCLQTNSILIKLIFCIMPILDAHNQQHLSKLYRSLADGIPTGQDRNLGSKLAEVASAGKPAW